MTNNQPPQSKDNSSLKEGIGKSGYDTTINVIVGLQDHTVLFKSIVNYFNPNDSIETTED